VVEAVSGGFQAELLRGLLEAQGIPAVLSQEGVGKVYSLTVGEFGRVEILVPAQFLEQARQVLDDYNSGKFEIEGEEE
jgi:hypothetical protein